MDVKIEYRMLTKTQISSQIMQEFDFLTEETIRIFEKGKMHDLLIFLKLFSVSGINIRSG